MPKKDNLISLPQLTMTLALGNLAREVSELKEQHQKLVEMTYKSLLTALRLKDDYTFHHSMRVAYYSIVLGKSLNLTNQELFELELSALFHDIGKIGVPDLVLLKPARLNEKEFLEMKAHPEKSAEILASFSDLVDVSKGVRHHHERFDGRGYPDNLKGEDIPLYARIILIADTFDAMTSTRPYRQGLPHEVAFQELEEFSGTQFDPNLVQHFVQSMRKENKKPGKTFHINILKQDFDKEAA